LDAGVPSLDGGGDGVSGRVEVRIEAQDADSETMFDEGSLEIAQLRARNDRGEAEEPRWDDVGEHDLSRSESFEAPGLPATYGGARIELVRAECQAHLRISRGELSDLEICLSGLASLELRCESPIELTAGGEILVDVAFEVRELDAALADRDFEDGATVDATSDPAAHAALLDAWQDAWSVHCRRGSAGDES